MFVLIFLVYFLNKHELVSQETVFVSDSQKNPR